MFVAVHAGAGFHASKDSKALLAVMERAAEAGANCTERDVVEAVAAAVAVLEDSELTNAGFGSALTEAGTVECDASVSTNMQEVCFAAVGAASCIKNPVRCAQKLLEQRAKGRLSLGRVRPSILTGPACADWAKRNGVDVVADDALISDSARAKWKRYSDAVAASASAEAEDEEEDEEADEIESKAGDQAAEDPDQIEQHGTVGAVACDRFGNAAAAVSSGGVWLKQVGLRSCVFCVAISNLMPRCSAAGWVTRRCPGAAPAPRPRCRRTVRA